MHGFARRSAATGATMCGKIIAGTSCSESTSGFSQRSETPGNDLVLKCLVLGALVLRCSARRTTHDAPRTTHRLNDRAGRLRRMRLIAVRLPLSPRTNVVALDHFVQRRRLDVQELGGALLHAAGRLQRRFDQPLLEISDHVLE